MIISFFLQHMTIDLLVGKDIMISPLFQIQQFHALYIQAYV